MDVFLKLTRERIRYYLNEITYLIGKGDSIIEFCILPIMDKSFNIDRFTEKELQIIADRMKEIVNMLKNFEKSLEKLNLYTN